MEIKILQVFYDKNGLPYKDKERTVHYPITTGTFLGASNTTQIRFYYDQLDELNESTFVAVSKLPNGKIGSEILESEYDSELQESYAILNLSQFYTQYKGDVYISLQGYQGGVRVEQDEDGIYQIYGTPTIQATGSIRMSVAYAPTFIGSGETENVNFQRVLAELSTKLGIRQETLHVEELPTVGNPNIWYVINDDPNDATKVNIYIWNATTQTYVWVGDNTLDLGNYYTHEQGKQFEENIDNRVTSVENELESVASGSPKGVYATLSDLETAYPTGTTGIYVVSADGHWYYWNGSAWTDGGVYQATEIVDGSVTPEKTTFFNIDKSINQYNKNSELNKPGYMIQGSGDYISISGSNVSHPIKVEIGKTYCFTITPDYFGASAVVVRHCQADGTLVEAAYSATNNDDIYGTFTVTDDSTEYVCVNVENVNEMMFVEGSTYPSTYKEYYETIKTIKEENIPVITPIKTNFFETISSTNLYNKDSELNKDNSIIQYSGDYQELNGSSVSHPIKVEYEKTYCFKWSVNYYGEGNNKWVRPCSSTGTLADYSLSAASVNDGEYGYFTVDDPTIEYVCVNVRESDKDGMIFAEGETLPQYSPYFEPKQQIKEEYLPTNEQNNVLYGKKLAVIGDSICYGAGYLGGYAKIIGENNNMTVSNIAQSGASITSGTVGRYHICDNITNMPSGYDYYIVEGGVNDAALDVLLGQLTNDYSSNLDTETMLGAIESICKTLQTTFVGKKYGFIFPHNVYEYTGQWNTTWRSAMKQALEKWGIPYIDLSDLCVQLRNIDALRIYTENNDGWHPTEEGYRLFYVPKIEAWLKTL